MSAPQLIGETRFSWHVSAGAVHAASGVKKIPLKPSRTAQREGDVEFHRIQPDILLFRSDAHSRRNLKEEISLSQRGGRLSSFD